MSSKFIKYNLYTFTRTNNLKIVKKKLKTVKVKRLYR